MHKPNTADILRHQLNAGAALTYRRMGQLTALGPKQIGRLINKLQKEGLPVRERREGRQKVFFLAAENQQVPIHDLNFDAAELRALAIAAKASQSVLAGTPHAPALGRAFGKLLDLARPAVYLFDLGEPMQEWYFDDNPVESIALPCFHELEAAMDERRSVRIDYLTAKDGRTSTSRKINPYFFARRNRAWMLIAHCHQRQKPLTFAMTRISQVIACDSATENAFYEIPDSFVPEDFFRASMGAITSDECYELRLLVEAGKAIHFRQRQYHPTQQVEEKRPDGRLVVSYELEGFEEMRSFCQGWGIGVTVLEPEALRERLGSEALELVRRYGFEPG